MAQSWKYAVLLGLVGVATAAGCTVTDGDDDFGGAAGEGGDSGSGGTGGSAGKGGTGGTAGKGGTGGTAGKGGAAGAAGKAGSGGTAGTTAGTGGSAGDSGSGGEGGDEGGPVTCDPDPDDPPLGSTPYDSCEPEDDDDECGTCIQENCCEESMECYGYDPKNVCGWGGPEGLGEIDCYESCLKEYVTGAEGVCDDDGIFGCLNACATEACGVIAGNQTTELAACMNANCPSECFGADSCEE